MRATYLHVALALCLGAGSSSGCGGSDIEAPPRDEVGPDASGSDASIDVVASDVPVDAPDEIDGEVLDASDASDVEDASDTSEVADADAEDADVQDGSDADDAADASDAPGDGDASDASVDAYPWPPTCTACHGTASVGPAPPVDTNGLVATTNPGVGAHQKHLAASDWHRDVQCTDCHLVPGSVPDPAVPTHLNGRDDIDWSPDVAKRGSFDPTTYTCSGVWCHGAMPQPDLAGTSPPTVRAPQWTKVDGTQALCGKACHTLPPGGGHPPYNACPACHDDVISSFTPATGGAPPVVVWKNAQRHVDGVIDYFDLRCTTCHGDPKRRGGDPAPPRGVLGETATSDPAVGAHQSHLSQTTWHRDVQCSDCHRVPTSVMHTNGVVDFDWSAGPASAGGATPAYDTTTVSCTGTWCHGAKLSGGAKTVPVWNVVDGTQKACGSCHGLPPTTGHPTNQQCDKCHSPVIASCPPANPQGCVFQPDVSPTQSYKLHINGKVDLVAGGCTFCHGAPPANGTHLAHAGSADPPTAYGSLEPRTNATSYAFNCGYCHPLDPAKHMDGKVEVELYDATAPALPTSPTAPGDRRALKSVSPAAVYQPGTVTFTGDISSFTDGSCANVYCHSAESPSATSVPLPTTNVSPVTFQWQSVTPFADVRQDQCCVATPDDYPDFAIDVARSFATPKWVGETHTGADKCAHCHGYPPRAEPPSNMGVGQGHAWMDSGWEDGHFFNMARGWPIQCRRCHSTTVADYLPPSAYSYDPATDRITFGQPMTISDFTLHLNGRKDVSFDLSPATCSSASPDLQYKTVPCLQTATYDPTTRSCANVECHLGQKKQTWGAPYRVSVGAECNACHSY